MQTEIERTTAQQESEDTRERILLVAQKFFADRGFDSTSVRDITSEAGCNVASVNYHFGGKDNLYVETFRSMLSALRDRRLSMLDELMVRTPPPTLEEFLRGFAEGFVEPLVDESRGRLFLAMVSREIFDERLPSEVFVGEFVKPMMDRTLMAMERFAPELDPEEARLCIVSLVGQLLHALKGHHLFTQHERSQIMKTDLASYIPHFVRFSAGGIRAYSNRPAPERESDA
jgi:AcrR family transcriptional regulator